MLFALLACADPPPPERHALANLFRPQVQLNTGAAPGGPEQIQVFVHPLTPGVCHPIPDLAATLDGTPMTRLHGKVEGEIPYDRDCSVFEFTLDGARAVVAPTNTLTVTDGVTTYTVTLAHLFDPRTVTPSVTDVKPGDTVTLAWSPPTDVLAKDGGFGVELTWGEAGRAVIRREAVTVGAGTVTFVVPEGVAGEVRGTVFGTATMRPAITRCDGAPTDQIASQPHACAVSRAYDVPPFTLRARGG